MEKAISLCGLAIMVALCWALSTNRRKVDWALVLKGTALQLLLALFVLKTSLGQALFHAIDAAVSGVLSKASEGAIFLFSKALADSETASRLLGKGNGFIFAFQALPPIIFISALSALLYHCGILQCVVRLLAWLMKKTMRLSGAEACAAAANVFLGQTEAPLVVRPYLGAMSRSELHCVMAGGMATVSGSILAAYVGMLNGHIEGITGHLVAASVMSAPAAVVFAKLLCPEEDEGVFGKSCALELSSDENCVEACSRGCSEGMRLVLNVAAMLVGFISLIALFEWLWGLFIGLFGMDEAFSLRNLLGWLFSPFAFLLGIPWTESHAAGVLLGEKTLLNEVVAYAHFAEMMDGTMAECSYRTKVIISYALCGFANFGSVGILIGGLGALVPKRQRDIAELAFRAMFAGTFASFSTAIIVGLLL